MQALWFLHFASHLMVIDINIKFREDILNSCQVIERKRFYDGQSSKGNNSKSMVLALCMSSNVD